MRTSTMSDHPPSAEEEERLVRRVATGDGEAFARLFDLCSPMVLGLLVRMLGRREEAEEILQEVFLTAWNRPESYDGTRGSVRGWLLLLARSRAIDRIRSRRSRSRREEAVHEERLKVAGGVAEPVGTRELEERERRRQVASALSHLPDEQRSAIELAFFEGLTQAEIARRTRTPLGTVKSRVLLGMRKLRQTLEMETA